MCPPVIRGKQEVIVDKDKNNCTEGEEEKEEESNYSPHHHSIQVEVESNFNFLKFGKDSSTVLGLFAVSIISLSIDDDLEENKEQFGVH